MTQITIEDRFRGSILGLAIGDALGHPTEFVSSLSAIRARWGEAGVTDFQPSGRHPAGTFTDDTQMALAVARALIRSGHRDLDTLMTVLGQEFVAWYRHPDNNRAPGGTCMSGCRNLAGGRPWRAAGVKGSKGCGAAMRAAPIGLYFQDDTAAMIRVAAAQSVLTHGHPTAVASSVAAAAPVAWAARGNGLSGMLDFTRECVSQLTANVLREAGCAEELAHQPGAEEMLAALDSTRVMLGREAENVCDLLGEGWIGEEAVATALWCLHRAQGGFRESVLRGANSSGDSDSIACIAGSIAGAMGGVGAIPPDWAREVEKATLLDRLARELQQAALERQQMRPDEERPLDPELDFFNCAAPRGNSASTSREPL
ncbi:MAG: ADP-ribosyl-[dinitrogen reductase] glycohydrolase [Thermoanaerobaculia bacterium]|nr:ADP-ribosyl-[dinitrogen reductase] glycohydrolase [Thermoanaerobaculia bacterium]